MIDIGVRVYVPHRGLFAIVTGYVPQLRGIAYKLLLETHDDSYVELIEDERRVTVAHTQPVRTRPRLVSVDGDLV